MVTQRIHRKVISRDMRNTILERDNYSCIKCGKRNVSELEIHHIFPVWQAGITIEFNLVTLCRKCHKDAPNNPVEFIRYCSKHMSPELGRSIEITKLMVLIILNDFELLSKTDTTHNEKVYTKINNRVSQLYDLLWDSLLGNVSKLDHLLIQANPNRTQVIKEWKEMGLDND